jgi:prevent-host-death family protein
MAILRVTMQKQYSIAEARDKLPSIVHEVEKAGPIKLTRRGKPVAVLIAESEYERLKREPHSRIIAHLRTACHDILEGRDARFIIIFAGCPAGPQAGA